MALRDNSTKKLVIKWFLVSAIAFQYHISEAATDSLADAKVAIRTRDFVEAKTILLPLAKGQNVQAQFLLGSLYLSGRLGSNHELLAFQWLSAAAEQQHAQAQYDLATIFEHGRGVEKNMDTALNWFNPLKMAGTKRAKK